MRLIDAEAVYKILESCEIRKATIEGKATDHFYRDCPIGICVEEEDAEREENNECSQ